MKVGLMTSWKNVCGLASYAEQLVEHKPDDVEYEIYDHARWNKEQLMSGKFDILHCNYANGQFGCEEMIKEVIRNKRCASVVTEHLSHDGSNWTDFTRHFDRMVIHERQNDGSVFIPMGIPMVNVAGIEPMNRIGTAGFPRHWKGMPEMAVTAQRMNMGITVIAPEGHADSAAMERYLRTLNNNVIYVREWKPMESVISMLATCKVTMFPYNTHGQGFYIDVGSSSAVRMGLASGRPTVVTGNCRQFNDLREFEDEVEFASTNSPNDLEAAVRRVLGSGKKPNRILKEWNWKRVGEMYRDLYQQILKEKGELCA